MIEKYFLSLAFSDSQTKSLAKKIFETLDNGEKTAFRSFAVESCFYVIRDENRASILDFDDEQKLIWLLSKPLSNPQKANLKRESFFKNDDDPNKIILEYGPRLSFTTAFSTNAVSACRAAGLNSIIRLERSFRFLINFDGMQKEDVRKKVASVLHDRMTECEYLTPPDTFDLKIQPQSAYAIDILGRGLKALEEANQKLGLSFDEDDMKYYLHLFGEVIKRNPTNVELFDLAQSNSEHSRHWFFKGRMILDGKEEPSSLFQMVMDTQNHSNANNVIKFCDNSSGIKGFETECLLVKACPSLVAKTEYERSTLQRHIIYTAETHNFPTGVCPFEGAATGTGGRIRDVQAAGRGAHVVAGVAGYCFGNLNIPGYKLPWETNRENYPPNFASPLDICIQASNGASDYGNKFGEPVICGFARSFGLRIPKTGAGDGSNKGERVEWVKPIMFSGGLGAIDDEQLKKEAPEEGMLVVKLGGPVYRIGVGGGSASSVHVQGDHNRHEDLDFGAVQRGDPEMEQKLNRVIRACVELGKSNPIASIHDQGAGGNGNVLKEIVEGAGAVIEADAFELGDKTINILELWGAEYQESNAVLVREERKQHLENVCRRERCACSIVGRVSNDNKIILKDFTGSKENSNVHPVDLPLDKVLASMPPKVFHLNNVIPGNIPLDLPPNLTVKEALERVLRLPSVASKRYLTNKVDRSVTGLVAQQQCVGPLQTPVADVAVVALSYFDTVGSAVAIGEQPIKGLVNPERGARMAVAEALTNLVFAPITCLKDVKCSANWMWPAKLSGEGANLLAACKAMCALMNQLGIAVDGGKDSLSMAARVGDEVVKAPGSLVISAYAPCMDITKVVTPDLKCPSERKEGGGVRKGTLLYVKFDTKSDYPLGGSALAQCFGQIGNECPDLTSAQCFSNAFGVTQNLIKENLIHAGHDVSDGGLITTILEMAFAGNCSLNIRISNLLLSDASIDALRALFAEEAAIVLEVKPSEAARIAKAYSDVGVFCAEIGNSEMGQEVAKVVIEYFDKDQGGGKIILEENLSDLRSIWEETSFELEKLQCNESCVVQENEVLKTYRGPNYRRKETTGGPKKGLSKNVPSVAVVREEGSNGDREMAAAFSMAGFEVWDVCMQDLLDNRIDLDRFRGVAFVGGFSYADVLGSAKGWASGIMFNEKLCMRFDNFYSRADTFSLGVCNGCQLMCLLRWVGPTDIQDESTNSGVFLDHNDSGRYESRFSTVAVGGSPAIMFKGMAGSVLGVWVSHGEGKFVFDNDSVLDKMENSFLIPLRYTDGSTAPTSQYPFNPNGSPNAVAGLCSTDGRHLAMMPHPERSFLPWQWPNWPQEWEKSGTSPWFKMFENAYDWCCLKEGEFWSDKDLMGD